MDPGKLLRNLAELSQGIDACLEKKLQRPALILLYSAIEIAGFLANDDPNAGSRQIFTAWVNRYLLPVRMLYCNADDLFGARCGLVHTLTSDSDMAAKGRARKVAYAWGHGDADQLQRWITQTGHQNELVAVNTTDLCNGWKEGVRRFLEELETDQQRQVRVLARAGRFFSEIAVDKHQQINWNSTQL